MHMMWGYGTDLLPISWADHGDNIHGFEPLPGSDKAQQLVEFIRRQSATHARLNLAASCSRSTWSAKEYELNIAASGKRFESLTHVDCGHYA